jgi:hypothetical protein
MKSAKLTALLMLVSLSIAVFPATAKSHTWRFSEAFSNADGSLQFIELHESLGLNDETLVPGHVIASTATGLNFMIPQPALPMTTANKRLLFATPAFRDLWATLPGAPVPDYIIPAGFFSRTSDTLTCTGWPNFAFTAGQLPTDGIHSLVCNLTSCTSSQLVVEVNSPTNYAGQTGSVDTSTPPPAIPDGSAGSTPMTVAKLNAAGTSLAIAFDTATCSGVTNRQIIYGLRSQLPGTLGGSFGLTGSACTVGGSPFTWDPAPDANPGTDFVWWLMTVRDGSNREGSWGKDSAGQERVGPAAGGSSGQCGVTTRNVSNVCGH